VSTNDDDEQANNAVATGALFTILSIAAGSMSVLGSMSALTSVTLPPDGPGNQVEVMFDFLASPYRLTVERVPDEG
jgi:hypothetical protein